MKVHEAGEKIRALCHNDGRVTAVFEYRDVPFRDKRGVAENLLVGVCGKCGEVILVPAQSTPAIAAARQRAERSLEVNLPSPFVEVLDAAAMRVCSLATTEFRKHLLMYYVNLYSTGREKPSELAKLANDATQLIVKVPDVPPKRLSMKVATFANDRIEALQAKAHLQTKTDLIKSLVVKIHQDIVVPDKPKHLVELAAMADVLYA